MANEENLKKGKETQFQSGEKAARNGQKGGIKSGEVRRRKKLLKECMENLLQMPVSDKKIYKKLESMGVAPEDIDNRYQITVALFLKAASGDVSAYKEIRDLMGENEKDNKLGKIDEFLEGINDVAVE